MTLRPDLASIMSRYGIPEPLQKKIFENHGKNTNPYIARKREDARCFYCGILTKRTGGRGPNARTNDHIYPRSKKKILFRRDGGQEFLNRVVACHQCNVEKDTMTFSEYRLHWARKFGMGIACILFAGEQWN